MSRTWERGGSHACICVVRVERDLDLVLTGASLAGASVHVRVSCLPGMDGPEAFSAGQPGGNESSHGGRTVRRALKNARSLISDLFARERFSGR